MTFLVIAIEKTIQILLDNRPSSFHKRSISGFRKRQVDLLEDQRDREYDQYAKPGLVRYYRQVLQQ